MFVCCECCVLSGRGLCDELITRPEESYRLCVVWYRKPQEWGGHDPHWIAAPQQEKKKYCTILQKVIRQAKHLYYNELIRTPGNKNKTLWKIINKKSGKSNLSKNIPTEFNLSSRFHYNPANVFNKYCLIITELRIKSNRESTKFSLKAAFPQGFPEIINIPIAES